MAATYFVLASDELMAMADLRPPEGFRFLEEVCPEPGRPEMHWWRVEDDGAPEDLEGKRVEVWFSRAAGVAHANGEPLGDGKTYVGGRTVVA